MTSRMDNSGAPRAEVRLASAPVPAEAAHIDGIAHYKADRFEQALVCFNRALALAPAFASAYNSRGYALQDLGRLDEALADFTRAVELSPEMAMFRLNLGMLQLKLGQFEAGWANYEARWTGAAEYQAGQFGKPQCNLPVWEGISGSTPEQDKARGILVITEQGFGDTFQFSRYLPLLAERFGKVGFACADPTRRLVDWSFGDGVVSFTRMPAPAGWDVQCALMSLPKALATQLDNIPGPASYLRAPAVARQHWRDRLDAEAPNKLRIGLAWAGRAQHHRDARRSLSLAQLAPLLRDPRVAWVSLQKWAPGDLRPDVPEGIAWIDWTDELGDFADSAALVSELDLVISVDSAMVHLAGGLGAPVWMLDRFDNEWRWLSGREDSPWYPQLRIFRQAAFGDWAPVIAGVAQTLKALPHPRADAVPAQSPRAAEAMPLGNSPSAPGPVQGPALSIDQAMHHAAQLQGAGRLKEAERVIMAILQARPDHAHALHLLGLVAYQAGQPAKAVEIIQRAVAVAPGEPVFHSNVAEMSRQLGRLPDAIRHGERAVALSPSMVSGHSNLGIAYFDAGDDERARACHERALAIEPRTPSSLNNLGSIARRAQDLEGAEAWYRRALDQNPEYLEAASNLGAVLVEVHRAQEAAAVLEQALERRPHFPEALCNLGLARLQQARLPEAQGLLGRALQLNPHYEAAKLGLARVQAAIEKAMLSPCSAPRDAG
ncbi:MAG: tetratricopeptide repeat protein [Pseudomonadota bacterium]